MPLETGPSLFRAHLPFIDKAELADELAGGELVVSVEVAGRKFEAPVPLRPFTLQAMGAASDALASLAATNGFLSDPSVTRATIEHLRDRFARHVGAGDTDLEALGSEAKTIIDYAADVEARRDPLRTHAGIRRFAYRSPLDGELSPFGMYVPKSYVDAPSGATKTYPLVVVLHGLNGKPVSMLRWFFGYDHEGRDAEWEDRHGLDVEPIEGFVLSPNAHGNAMYRELGELDVVKLIDWAAGFYPIDPNRITITGASMGGTGTASIAFHYPDRFAAAEPLCGYHSYFIRKDVTGFGMWPWEKLLAEYRSPMLWAENGLYIPLYVWHGKRDYPAKNSGVLIDRYTALGYAIEHEHPDIGHDVWRKAYEGGLAFKWLSQKTRPEHKKRILFKTDSPRYLDNAWVHLREIATDLEFSTIDASIVDKSEIEVATRGVEAFALDRDPELVSSTAPTRVKIDGAPLEFAPEVPIAAYRSDGGAWKAGLKAPAPGTKRAGLSGPMRDAFFEPLVFVYGTADPAQTRANRETARAWARIKWGVDVRYPLVTDAELDESTAETHSLVLVGNADSNRVVRDLEPRLPFKVGAGSITAMEGGVDHQGMERKGSRGRVHLPEPETSDALRPGPRGNERTRDVPLDRPAGALAGFHGFRRSHCPGARTDRARQRDPACRWTFPVRLVVGKGRTRAAENRSDRVSSGQVSECLRTSSGSSIPSRPPGSRSRRCAASSRKRKSASSASRRPSKGGRRCSKRSMSFEKSTRSGAGPMRTSCAGSWTGWTSSRGACGPPKRSWRGLSTLPRRDPNERRPTLRARRKRASSNWIAKRFVRAMQRRYFALFREHAPTTVDELVGVVAAKADELSGMDDFELTDSTVDLAVLALCLHKAARGDE